MLSRIYIYIYKTLMLIFKACCEGGDSMISKVDLSLTCSKTKPICLEESDGYKALIYQPTDACADQHHNGSDERAQPVVFSQASVADALQTILLNYFSTCLRSFLINFCAAF